MLQSSWSIDYLIKHEFLANGLVLLRVLSQKKLQIQKLGRSLQHLLLLQPLLPIAMSTAFLKKKPLVQPFFSFSLMVFPPPTCHLHLPENDILDCANWQSITFCLNYWAFPLWNTDVKVTLCWFRTNNQNSPLFSETKTSDNGLIIKCPWNVLSSPRYI